MWIKKIKKKKVQFLLVSLMLCFTSAIFAACISFVAEVSHYTDEYTSYQNCPRVIAIAEETYDEDYFAQYPELMANTAEIKFCDVVILQNLFYFCISHCHAITIAFFLSSQLLVLPSLLKPKKRVPLTHSIIIRCKFYFNVVFLKKETSCNRMKIKRKEALLY